VPTIDAVLARVQRARSAANALWDIYGAAPAPPASESALVDLEKKFGFALPEDYRAFLQRHDGWDGYEYDAYLLSVAELAAG
jgi:cell wall assembly regulator SMI1